MFRFYFFWLPSSWLLQERFWIVSEIKNSWLFQFWECPAVCVSTIATEPGWFCVCVVDSFVWLIHFCVLFFSALQFWLVHIEAVISTKWSWRVLSFDDVITLLPFLNTSRNSANLAFLTNRQVIFLFCVAFAFCFGRVPNTIWMTFLVYRVTETSEWNL